MTIEVIDSRSDVQDRAGFELVLAELSSRFINLAPGDVDDEIADDQRRVCHCLGLDISALWQL